LLPHSRFFQSLLKLTFQIQNVSFIRPLRSISQIVNQFIAFWRGTVAVVTAPAAALTVTVAAVADGFTHSFIDVKVHVIAIRLLCYLAFVAVVESV
jgi:hypothetical protein